MLVDVDKSFLLIVDIQERLCNAMPEPFVENVIHNTEILIEAAKTLDVPLALTEQYPKGLGPTVKRVADAIGDREAFEKTCFSSCDDKAMFKILNDPQIEHVILTGIETHICILQTAFDLLANGKQVFIAADAVCSRKTANYKNAIARMQQAGIIISNTESILFEWLKDTQHPKFKALSKLIR